MESTPRQHLDDQIVHRVPRVLARRHSGLHLPSQLSEWEAMVTLPILLFTRALKGSWEVMAQQSVFRFNDAECLALRTPRKMVGGPEARRVRLQVCSGHA